MTDEQALSNFEHRVEGRDSRAIVLKLAREGMDSRAKLRQLRMKNRALTRRLKEMWSD